MANFQKHMRFILFQNTRLLRFSSRTAISANQNLYVIDGVELLFPFGMIPAHITSCTGNM